MPTEIRNLYEEIIEVAGDEQDRRFANANWVKVIDSVDPRGSDGYAFTGDFVRKGTVEVEVKPTLFLVASTSGSMKHHYTTYRVVTMDGDGALHRREITTDNSTSGWALRIRDQVKSLLAEINAPAVVTQEAAPVGDASSTITVTLPDGTQERVDKAVFDALVQMSPPLRSAFYALVVASHKATNE